MKTIFSRCLLLLLLISRAHGQYTIDFSTYRPCVNIEAPVFDTDHTTPLNDQFLGQLYLGSTVDNLTAVGVPLAFRNLPGTTTGSGYILGGVVDVPPSILPIPGSSMYIVQLRAWKSSDGATYETALAAKGKTGKSAMITVQGTSPPATPNGLTGLQSFSLTSPLDPLYIDIYGLGPSLKVSWSGGSAPSFVAAATLDGPWQTVAGASSPYTFSASGTSRFFKLVEGQSASKIVGYVNIGLVQGYNHLSNPLFSEEPDGNKIKNLFAALPPGSQVYKYNSAAQKFDVAMVDEFTGEITGTIADVTVLPGEGVFVLPPISVTLTFSGEIQTGQRNPVPTGISVGSSPIPKTGRIATDLAFPASNGDSIHVFLNSSQKYLSFHYSTLLGWLPSEPVIQPGQAFWIMTSQPKDWTSTFNP